MNLLDAMAHFAFFTLDEVQQFAPQKLFMLCHPSADVVPSTCIYCCCFFVYMFLCFCFDTGTV